MTILGLLIIAAVFFVILGSMLEAERRKKLGEWAAQHGLTFDAGKDRSLDERFREFDCLRQGDDRYGYNFLSGQWDKRDFLGFDYHYATHIRDSKGRRRTIHHHFSAVIVGSAVPLKELLIRPESVLDKLAAFVGWDDIDFESAEFSRKYFVKSPDRRWAYDVLHTRAMQLLLDCPQYCIEFGPRGAIAWRDSAFSTEEFASAADLIDGLLDMLPEYLVQQMGETSGRGQ
jgi:hypothetical protein